LRNGAALQEQFEAARAYAPEVARLDRTSHRYTAGQAATLAWLLGLAGDPLPINATCWPITAGANEEMFRPTERKLPEVRRLEQQTRGFVTADGNDRVLSDGPGDAMLMSRPYALGVMHTCQWALGATECAPFRPRPA
jgi:hypothetical protein